jgi:hypothetical protein
MRGIGFSGVIASAMRPRLGAASPSIAHRGTVGDLALSPRDALDPDGRQT